MTAERCAWLPAFIAQLRKENILVDDAVAQTLAPARLVAVDVEDWGALARQAALAGLRWCAVWGEEHGEELSISACFEHGGDYLIARTAVSAKTPILPSHTPHYAAADRPGRHLQDMFGVVIADHPDARRWTRHNAWTDSEFPLRKGFDVAGEPPLETAPHSDYRFMLAQGAGVYEIPVGPIHAGIIEPGHFRFQAVGETVLNLEERLGYTHKGIEKIAEGRDPVSLARLAGRVSGDTTVAHAWAACMAMERAADIEIPERALCLRALLAERERIINHLWDVAMICNDVSYAFGFYQFGRLREDWLRLNRTVFGHRLMMDRMVPGGVSADVDVVNATLLLEQGDALNRELDELLPILADNASLQDRLQTTGVLSVELAARFGCVGYVGRASGQDFDVRRDAPYAPYDRFDVAAPVFTSGDVAARMHVRFEELRVSLRLQAQILASLAPGELRAMWRRPTAGSEGLGIVDGWRGEIISFVRFDAQGCIARYFPRDPSWLTWPALEKLIRDNIVPDFPVCNKSVNASYSGHDL